MDRLGRRACCSLASANSPTGTPVQGWTRKHISACSRRIPSKEKLLSLPPRSSSENSNRNAAMCEDEVQSEAAESWADLTLLRQSWAGRLFWPKSGTGRLARRQQKSLRALLRNRTSA